MIKQPMIGIFFVAAVAFLTAAGCAGPQVAENPTEAARLRDLAARAKQQLRENGAATPEAMSQASLQALDRVLSYTDEVKADPTRFDPEKIAFYSHQIDIINANIERFKDPRYTVTLTFAPGGYLWTSLPSEEKSKGREMASFAARTVADLHSRHPGYAIRVTLKAVGFTDEMPIVSQQLKAAVLTQLADGDQPESEFRALYNTALSTLRADDVARRMILDLQAAVPAGANVRYVRNHIGMGERFPPTPDPSSPPYGPSDPRRRICIMTAYIETLL